MTGISGLGDTDASVCVPLKVTRVCCQADDQ